MTVFCLLFNNLNKNSMKKQTLLIIILCTWGIFSCTSNNNNCESVSRVSNMEMLTAKKWKIEKVKQLLEGEYKVVYDRNSSLFNLGNEYSNLKMKFLQNKTMKIYTNDNGEETGKWEFVNHESQIKSRKFDQKDFIVLHINRIEQEELVFTQIEDGKIMQYDFSPI